MRISFKWFFCIIMIFFMLVQVSSAKAQNMEIDDDTIVTDPATRLDVKFSELSKPEKIAEIVKGR